MSYTTPAFNLVCNIWHSPGNPLGAPSLSPGCNLQFALHTKAETASGLDYAAPYLLLPKLTDIRGFWNSTLADVVEVPSGSGRLYNVRWVDDVGKGFANEYRIAGLNQVLDPFAEYGVVFPVPLP